jgi:hypothetical protein
MSRKHFTALAYELKNVRPEQCEHSAYAAWWTCVQAVANACAESNGRFQSARFFAACGADGSV